MSFLNLIADIDPSPREVTEKQDRTIRENAEMERQTTEDVKEFLAEQAAGKAHSMTDTSGTIGKAIVGLMMVLSLAGIFTSCAKNAMAEPTVATQTVQVQKNVAQYPTQTITLSR